MTPKLTVTTTAFVRVLSAVGALTAPMAIPSLGASIEVSAGDSSMPSSIEGGVAAILTSIDVQRGTNDIRVVITGDGKLPHHEVARLDERRLLIDIPGVASAISKPVISVNHQFLKRVRTGYHADRVRVVLDLAGTVAYSVEPQGANLIVTLREGVGTDVGADKDSPRGEAVETIGSENRVMPVVLAADTSRVAHRTTALLQRTRNFTSSLSR
jgi:AMIN domain